jgi:hypothetical protein
LGAFPGSDPCGSDPGNRALRGSGPGAARRVCVRPSGSHAPLQSLARLPGCRLSHATGHLARTPDRLTHATNHLAHATSLPAHAPSHLAHAPSLPAHAPSRLSCATNHLAHAPSLPAHAPSRLSCATNHLARATSLPAHAPNLPGPNQARYPGPPPESSSRFL